MKKILYIMCAMLVFASCNKEPLPITNGQNPDGSYTFNIGIEEPDYAPQTRAVAVTRYMLEMYESNLTATPVKMSNSTGVFNVELKRGVDYICLFWADGGSTAYDATSLQAVKQTTETALGTAAYCARVTVNSNNFNGAIKLRHAVAELSFIDKNGLTKATNTLKITYPYASATLNVGDGTVTPLAGETVRTISNITPPTVATTAFAADFILAPTAAGNLAGLKLQLNSELVKTIAETVIQANYRTKISGEFQPKQPKVGDFYYKNGNLSSTYAADANNPCIGIVFVVNADGTTGKIVSLDEGRLMWSTEYVTTGANSEIDGAVNTAIIFALSSYNATVYPAFGWCADKNTPATAGINWYIPAKDELFALYDVWNGSSSGLANEAFRAAFNEKLTTSGGSKLGPETYWSSTEYNNDNIRSWYIGFWKRSSGGIEKNDKPYYVRCVSVVHFK